MVEKDDSEAHLNPPLVSVVLPCLNEEEALLKCLEKIALVFKENQIDGEIVVSDNGSTDRSIEIAENFARENKELVLTHQPKRGYGNAYLQGFKVARGKYLIMGDADDTYDFNLIPDFVSKLDEGFEFVTGSRYSGGGHGEITFLHRWIGNPMLTLILNILFGTKYSDVYCGYRAFTRKAFDQIRPVSPGMEFNLELAINAQLADLKIKEIPIVLAPRLGESKLSTFKDGWRSLRMMILYAPNKVFMLPGVFLCATGAILHMVLLMRLIEWQGRHLGTVSGIVATILTVVGFEILSLGLHAKTYSWSRRFDKSNKQLLKFYSIFNLEAGLALGALMSMTGAIILAYSVMVWIKIDLVPLPRPEWVPFAATLIIIGCSTIFSSIFISAMSITKNEDTSEG